MTRNIATTMQENGPPLGDPIAFYDGHVMHARLNPFGHRFRYSVFSVVFDIDKIDAIQKASKLFSINRFNLMCLFEKDHTENNEQSLSAYARQLLEKAELAEEPARIILMTYPRIFGYAFNPLSVYYVYNNQEVLIAAIYEVRNTFGARHSYVARVEQGELTPSGLKQKRQKLFHVSPFIDMGARYHFSLLPPGQSLRVRIMETENSQPLLSASFVGTQAKLTTLSTAQRLIQYPFMTLKIILGIHWEALKLWIKGAKFHKSPTPPPAVSYIDNEQFRDDDSHGYPPVKA